MFGFLKKKKEKTVEFYLLHTSKLVQEAFDQLAKADEHILSGPSGLYPAKRAVKKANFIFTEIIDNLKILHHDYEDISSYAPYILFCANVGLPLLLELKAEEHFFIPEIQEAWNTMVKRIPSSQTVIMEAVVIIAKMSGADGCTTEEPKKRCHDNYEILATESEISDLNKALSKDFAILLKNEILKDLCT